MPKVKELQQYMAQCLAECFSTFMLVLIGEAAIAQYKFSGNPNQSPIIVNVSFGIGVYLAIMIAGPISGAHLNPAVSISLLTIRKLKPIQCLFYILGQMLGAFFGGIVVYYLHWGLFNQFDGGVRQIAGVKGTADIFFTMPSAGVSNGNAFFDQIVGTAILMIFIMAIGNDFNLMVSEVAKPFGFVLIIVAITSAFAGNAGAAINPARDLGPRLFAASIYGWNVFKANNYFFWVPIIGPIVGAIIGVWLFEGYLSVMKRFANLPNVAHIGSVELHPKIAPIDDEDHVMMTQKLTSVHS